MPENGGREQHAKSCMPGCSTLYPRRANPGALWGGAKRARSTALVP
jgi:hypothetical protein